MSDLHLLPTNELIDELKGRFDDFILFGQKKETDKRRLDTWDFVGDYTNCLGMCATLMHKISQDRDEHSDSLEEAP